MTICGPQSSNAKTRMWRRFSRYVIVCQMSARSRHQSARPDRKSSGSNRHRVVPSRNERWSTCPLGLVNMLPTTVETALLIGEREWLTQVDVIAGIRHEASGDLKVRCSVTAGSANTSQVDIRTRSWCSRKRISLYQRFAAEFSRSDLERPVTRAFCPTCGTAIGTRSPARPGSMIIKVGTLDDPSVFEPKAAIFTVDMQPFHSLPADVPSFERRPG